jgi:hypothetical protein
MKEFHVKWVPCHHGMAHPQVADRGDGLLIWRVIAVRHHLSGMELLLSSRYMVPLRCSYCCSSREHEFLDLREFLREIELLCVVQEKSLVYSKQKKTLLHGQ